MEKNDKAQQRLAQLREDEEQLIGQIKLQQKKVRELIEQLKAVQNLVAEAFEQTKLEEHSTKVREQSKQRKEILKSLEDVVEDTKQQFIQANVQEEYSSINAQKLSLASQGTERLYQLAEKSDPWTSSEQKEFLELKDAIQSTVQYDLSKSLREDIDRSYEVLKNVLQEREEDIKKSYQQLLEQQRKTTMQPVNQYNNNLK